MRKYFLLGVAALLSVSTANATTDYAEVTAKATIEVAGTMECFDFNWGTIVVKQNNAASKVIAVDKSDFLPAVPEYSGDVLYVSGSDISGCMHSSVEGGTVNVSSDTVELKGSKNTSNTLLMSNIRYYKKSRTSLMGLAELDIPPSVVADTYSGSFTVSFVY